jgi:hypothetical protein
MILRRIIAHFRKQEWTAIFLDFLIVVVGVFVGLQVNNWNAARGEQNQIRAYMLALKEDIANDREMLAIVTDQINDTLEKADRLADYGRGRALEEFDNLDLYLLVPSGTYRPYSWNRTTFAQLSATGGASNIKDAELREMVADYQAKTEHLDLDYENDESLFGAVIELSNSVIDRNYPDRSALSYERLGGFEKARASEAYLAAQALNLPVTATDIREVRQMINSILILQGNLRPRAEREIPELIDLGASIIERIDQEYGD